MADQAIEETETTPDESTDEGTDENPEIAEEETADLDAALDEIDPDAVDETTTDDGDGDGSTESDTGADDGSPTDDVDDSAGSKLEGGFVGGEVRPGALYRGERRQGQARRWGEGRPGYGLRPRPRRGFQRMVGTAGSRGGHATGASRPRGHLHVPRRGVSHRRTTGQQPAERGFRMMGIKQSMIESAIGDSEAIGHVTGVIADLETDLLEEVAAVQEAHGEEPLDVPDEQQRAEALRSLIKSQIAGDLEGWYATHVLPNHVENPEKAEPLIGLDAEEWDERKQSWADSYSEQVDTDVPPEKAAEKYISNQFGVSVEEFEANVVNWDPGSVIEHALGGNHRAAIQALEGVREGIEEENDQ